MRAFFNTRSDFHMEKTESCDHIETSPLNCSANQLTGFYTAATLALKVS